jgi:hypothetical protein
MREKCLEGFGMKSWRKETIGKSRHRWEDNIKMDLKQTGRA